MIIQLTVQNFLLIENLSLNFTSGLTLFTGETGAGKSILFEALSFLLGARAPIDMIQKDKTFCTVSVRFKIHALSEVRAWLKNHQLENIEDTSLCTLKRVLFQEGRSQGFINGKPISIKHLKALGELLITVHGQHSQQALLKAEHQQWLLDSYGDHKLLLHKIQKIYKDYANLKHQAQDLIEQIQTKKNQASLLEYQLEELDALSLKTGEWEQLSQEQKKLSQVEYFLEHIHKALSLIDNTEFGAADLLHQIKQHLEKLSSLQSDSEENIVESIEQALVHLMETRHILHHILDTLNLDPERLALVEQRLSSLHEVARKHGVTVEALPSFEQHLRTETDQLADLETKLFSCQKAQENCIVQYQSLANELSERRQQVKTQLAALVSEKIQHLGMEGGIFEIKLLPIPMIEPKAHGQENIEFYLSASHGQPMQRLSKAASGGELSRISLVMNTQISEKSTVPSLIFDEVDTGMSGGAAERVGQLLRHIADTKQVLCVTHLPQVAVFAQSHYRIYKQLNNTESDTTVTQVESLVSPTQRINEIARMLGGIHITPQTLKLAQELLTGLTRNVG